MHQAQSLPTARPAARPLTTLAIGIAVAASLLFLIAARPHGETKSTAAARTMVGPEVTRSAAERAFNEGEDLKAARYVGVPGIY